MNKEDDYMKIIRDYVAQLSDEEIEESFANTVRREISNILFSDKCIRIQNMYLSHLNSTPERFTDVHLREFIDYVDWDKVSHEGKMSLDFMREWKDKLNPFILADNKYIFLKDKIAMLKCYEGMEDRIEDLELYGSVKYESC